MPDDLVASPACLIVRPLVDSIMRTSLAVRSLRCLIIAGLVTLVSASAADVETLVRVLRDPDKTTEAKGDACLQLMDMGPTAAPAVPSLVGLLNSPEEMLRDYAVTTLDRIGSAARNALPALRRTAAKDTSPEIRELARSAIARIAGGAPAAGPANSPVAAPEPAPTSTPARRESAVPGTEPQAAEPEPVAAPPETPAAESEAPRARHQQSPPRPVRTDARPTLEVHQGRYFRWAVPISWVGSESPNGVTLTASDGLMRVSSALPLGSSGRMTPADFTVWLLGQIPENRSLQVIEKRDLPDQPSGLDTPWKVQELDMRYTVNGVPIRALWTTGIVSLDGTYHAYIIGYQSIPMAFERAKLWLASVAHSIALASPVQGPGNDRLLIPTSHPPDCSALLKHGARKGVPRIGY